MTTPSDDKPKHKLGYDSGMTYHDVANCPECEKGMVKDMKKLTDAIADHHKPKESYRSVITEPFEAPKGQILTDRSDKPKVYEMYGHEVVMKSALTAAETSINQLNSECLLLGNKIDDLVAKLTAAEALRDEAVDKYGALSVKYSDAADEIAKLSNVIAMLNRQSDEASSAAEAEIARLKRQLADYEHECETIKEMKAKLTDAEREIASEKSIAEHWKGNMNLARNERDYFQAENERLTKENAEQCDEILVTNNAQHHKDAWKYIDELQQRNKEFFALKKQNEEQAKEIERLERIRKQLELEQVAHIDVVYDQHAEIIAVLEAALKKYADPETHSMDERGFVWSGDYFDCETAKAALVKLAEFRGKK